jgi:hypothetical protein
MGGYLPVILSLRSTRISQQIPVTRASTTRPALTSPNHPTSTSNSYPRDSLTIAVPEPQKWLQQPSDWLTRNRCIQGWGVDHVSDNTPGHAPCFRFHSFEVRKGSGATKRERDCEARDATGRRDGKTRREFNMAGVKCRLTTTIIDGRMCEEALNLDGRLWTLHSLDVSYISNLLAALRKRVDSGYHLRALCFLPSQSTLDSPPLFLRPPEEPLPPCPVALGPLLPERRYQPRSPGICVPS